MCKGDVKDLYEVTAEGAFQGWDPRDLLMRGQRTENNHDMSYEMIMDDEGPRREKEKARSLRKTHWWSRKIQHGVCHYCRRHVGRANLTMDHVVPLSRGGKSKKGNIVAACKDCNNKKKYLLPVEWKEYLEGISSSGKSP